MRLPGVLLEENRQLRIVPTWLHGIVDYLVSVVVIALPFGFGWQGGARGVYVALGCIGILYSLMTDYESAE